MAADQVVLDGAEEASARASEWWCLQASKSIPRSCLIFIGVHLTRLIVSSVTRSVPLQLIRARVGPRPAYQPNIYVRLTPLTLKKVEIMSSYYVYLVLTY